MKKIVITIFAAAVIFVTPILSYSGDEEWATAGKVLAIVEGVRVITGGNVDVIGNVTGINKNGGLFSGGHSNSSRYRPGNRYKENYACSSNRVWVPHYVWKKRYVPEHEEYSKQYGTILVEGHYVKYKVEDGGHWEF